MPLWPAQAELSILALLAASESIYAFTTGLTSGFCVFTRWAPAAIATSDSAMMNICLEIICNNVVFSAQRYKKISHSEPILLIF